MKLIDKDALVAEIERRLKKYATLDVGNREELEAIYGAKCKALIDILKFLNNLEVKEVDFETDEEREYLKCNIAIFDKKFPVMPTLKGQYLHDYKNFLNTCQQIFGLKYWGINPTQAILFEKLSLLWATWGAQHLKGLFEMSSEERQKMDIEKENKL